MQVPTFTLLSFWGAPISAFTRVHSPSKTGVSALMDTLWARAWNDRGGGVRKRMTQCKIGKSVRSMTQAFGKTNEFRLVAILRRLVAGCKIVGAAEKTSCQQDRSSKYLEKQMNSAFFDLAACRKIKKDKWRKYLMIQTNTAILRFCCKTARLQDRARSQPLLPAWAEHDPIAEGAHRARSR